MRLSIFFFILFFVAFSIYLGWEQGAFKLKRMEQPVVTAKNTVKADEVAPTESPAAAAKSGSTKRPQSETLGKEPLKSGATAPKKEPVTSPSKNKNRKG